MPKIDPVSYRIVERGIVQGVDALLAPKESVYLGVNFDFDRILGSATVIPGNALLGNSTGLGKCLGGTTFVKSNGTKVVIAVFNNAGGTSAALYYLNAGTWTACTAAALTVNLDCVFVTLLNEVVVSNGTDTVVSSTDGITWAAAGGNLDVANFPKMKTMIEWHDQIYGVLNNSDRVLFSSTPTGGAISWTSGNGYIDVEPEDGGGTIVALSKVPNYILFFKERSLKRWDGQSTYPDDMMNIGTISQKTVCVNKSSCFFINQQGVYETNGGYPVLRSRAVEDIVSAISSFSNACCVSDDKNVEFAIGSISIDGITYSNAAIRYNTETQQWGMRSYYRQPVTYFKYVSTFNETVFGSTDGTITQLASGEDDTGHQIGFTIQTQEIALATAMQQIMRIVIHSRGMAGARVYARVDKGDFIQIGSIEKNNQLIDGLNLLGTYFEFRISGFTSASDTRYMGITLLDVNVTTDFS